MQPSELESLLRRVVLESTQDLRAEVAELRAALPAARSRLPSMRDDVREFWAMAPAMAPAMAVPAPTAAVPAAIPVPLVTPASAGRITIGSADDEAQDDTAAFVPSREEALRLQHRALEPCGGFDPSAQMRFHMADYWLRAAAAPPTTAAPSLNDKDAFFHACCEFIGRSGGMPDGHIGGKKMRRLEAWLRGPEGRGFLEDQKSHVDIMIGRARDGANGKDLLGWVRTVQVLNRERGPRVADDDMGQDQLQPMLDFVRWARPLTPSHTFSHRLPPPRTAFHLCPPSLAFSSPSPADTPAFAHLLSPSFAFSRLLAPSRWCR